MAGSIPHPESSFPEVPNRHTIIPPLQHVVANGTSLPVVGLDQFIPLMLTGSYAEVLDFVRFRYGNAGVESVTGTLRHVPSGTTADGSGTAVSDAKAFDAAAHTNYSFAITPTANVIPANSLLYLAFSAAESGSAGTQGLSGLALDLGSRQLTN